MTLYISTYFGEDLERLGLHEAVRATFYGIQIIVANFYAIFELFCPATWTFFTPVGELGLALYEMWEVSALPMGSLSYKEFFPCEAELALLEKQEPALFETYRELMCHFYICLDVHDGFKGNSNRLKSRAEYLFLTLEKAPKEARFGVVEDILQMMKEHDQGDILLEEDEGIYEKGDTFKSFHHQARQLVSQKVLLAGFMSVWLKRYVVPSPPHDVILSRTLLSAIQLVRGSSVRATPGHGVLHTAWSSCANGGLL